jgi:hypothetical protein
VLISPPDSLDVNRCIDFSYRSMNAISGNKTPTNALHGDDAHQITSKINHAAASTPCLLDSYCCTMKTSGRHIQLIPCYAMSAKPLDGDNAL